MLVLHCTMLLFLDEGTVVNNGRPQPNTRRVVNVGFTGKLNCKHVIRFRIHLAIQSER